jgi:hypothetical protein
MAGSNIEFKTTATIDYDPNLKINPIEPDKFNEIVKYIEDPNISIIVIDRIKNTVTYENNNNMNKLNDMDSIIKKLNGLLKLTNAHKVTINKIDNKVYLEDIKYNTEVKNKAPIPLNDSLKRRLKFTAKDYKSENISEDEYIKNKREENIIKIINKSYPGDESIKQNNSSNEKFTSSEYYLGRIFNYKILQNSRTGKCIYLIGEEHNVTNPDTNKKIVSMYEFLRTLTKVHSDNNSSLKILTEGIVNKPNIAAGRLHRATINLNNGISTDLREDLIKLFKEKYPYTSVSDYRWDKPPEDYNESLRFESFYNENGINIIKNKFPFLSIDLIRKYKKIIDSEHYYYTIGRKNSAFNPIIEIATICLIEYFHEKTNLVYYAHGFHIESIYKYIKTYYDKVLFKYEDKLVDSFHPHCKYFKDKRICDQNYLLNLTPKVFLPFKNDELYMNIIKQTYEQTKERKML